MSQTFKDLLSSPLRSPAAVASARLALWTLLAADAMAARDFAAAASSRSGNAGLKHLLSLCLICTRTASLGGLGQPQRVGVAPGDLFALLSREDDILGPVCPGRSAESDILRQVTLGRSRRAPVAYACP